MDFWKLSIPKRTVLVSIFSLVLILSGVSAQGIAEALEETTAEKTETVAESSQETSQTNAEQTEATEEETTSSQESSTSEESASTSENASTSESGSTTSGGMVTSTSEQTAVSAAEERTPERWTIVLEANDGALVEGADEQATTIKALEDGDSVTLPNVYAREGYEFVGWSTVADPDAWWEAHGVDDEGAPLFAPAKARLHNLTCSYVELEDGTMRQVSDDVAAQGIDEEGREVTTSDLRTRVSEGTLTLYAQWEEAEAQDEEGEKGSSTSSAKSAEEQNAQSEQGASVDTDEEAGSVEQSTESTQNAEPVTDSPTGIKGLLADSNAVIDSAAGDAEATEVLDQVEKDMEAREVFSTSRTATSTSALGLSALSASLLSAQSTSSTAAGSVLQAQDSTSESVTLTWVTADDNIKDIASDDDDSRLTLYPGYDNDVYMAGTTFLGDDTALSMQAKLQLSLASDKSYSAGTIQITVPAQFVENRSGNLIGSLSIDVPEEPDASYYFAYRLVTPTSGNPYYGNPYYVITNTRTIDGSASYSFLLTYSNITPHEVKSRDIQQGLQATLSVVDGTTATSSNALTAQINTSESIYSAYHNGGTVVAYAGAPETVQGALDAVSGSVDNSASNYVLVRWNTYATVKGNQTFTLAMKDELTDSGDNPAIKNASGGTVTSAGSVVLGTSALAPKTAGSTSFTKDIFAGTEAGDSLTSGYLANGETCYETVWTAYPASLFDDGATYTITNLVTWTLTSTDTASESSIFNAASITYKKPTTAAFPDSVSNNYAISKETLDPHKYSTSDNEALNELSTGTDVTVGFTVTASGEIMSQTKAAGDETPDIDIATAINNGTATVDTYFHQQYVTVEASDDVLYLNRNYTSELGSDDYYVSQVSVNDPLVYTYDHTDGDETQDWAFQRNTTGQLPDMALYGLSETSGGTATAWTKLATVSYDGNNNRTVSAEVSGVTASDDGITIDSSLAITRVKLIASTKTYDKIELSYSPYITLRHDSSRITSLLTELFDNSTTPTATIRNDATLLAYNGDAVGGSSTPTIDPAAATADDETNIIALTHNYTPTQHMKRTAALDDVRYGMYMEHGTSLAYLRGVTPQIGVTSSKSCTYDRDKDLDTSAMQATLHYTATVHEQSNVTSRDQYAAYVDAGIITPETSGTWYDLLPPGVEPDLSSITLRDADALVDAYTIANYKKSGRTLLVVKAKLVPVLTYGSASDYWAEGYYDEPKIEFDAVYSYADYDAGSDENDTLVNVIAFESGNNALGNVDNMMGEPDDASVRDTYNNSQTKDAVSGVESYMTDLNASHNNPVFVYARGETSLTISRTVTSSTKTVASDAEGIYRRGAGENAAQVNVYAGQGYTYRINVGSSYDASNIVIYDALESYAPSDSDTDAGIANYTWKGTFASVDTSELTDAGASPTVYYSTSTDITSSTISSHTKLTDSSYWSTTPPDALSTVTAIAIDCGSTFTLKAGTSVPVYIHMTAPDSSGNYTTVNESGSEDDPNNNSHAFNSAYITMGDSDPGTSTAYTKVGILPYKVTVSKVWDDGDDQDKVRPTSVTVNLLANGTQTSTVKLGSAYANTDGYSDDGWTYTYSNLPSKDSSGNAIRYTVSEESVSDYTPSYLRLDDTHLQITNKYVPETVEVCGTKTWVDNDDAAGKRPSTILIRLYADGVYHDSQRIGADTNGVWSYSFADLPAKSGGKAITYTVEEDAVDYYATDYTTSTSDTAKKIDITNSYSATGMLAIDKTVTGTNVKSASKEFTFTVELFDPILKDSNGNPQPLYGSYPYYLVDSSGTKVGTISNGGTITLGAGQKAIISGIPVNSTYKVTEQSTAGFSLTSSENTSGTVTAGVDASDAVVASFTNTYSSSGSFQLQATKVLTGEKLAAGTFQFKAYEVTTKDGTETKTLASTASNRAGSDLDSSSQSSTGDVVFSRINVTNDDLESDGTLTRTYEISEVIPDGATNADGTYTYNGYTYDSSTGQVKVTFTDAGDGTITITQTEPPTFTNASTGTHTSAAGSISLQATKTMETGVLSEGDFTFELLENGTVLQKVGNLAPTSSTQTGLVLFDEIEYSTTDAREHTYTIREVVPDNAVNSNNVTWSAATDEQKAAGGFKYDGIVYGSGDDPNLIQTVTVEVTNDGNDKLTVTADGITNAVGTGSLKVATTAIGTNEAVKNTEFRYSIQLNNSAGQAVAGFYDICFYDADGNKVTKKYTDGGNAGEEIKQVEFSSSGLTEGITNIKSGEYFVISGLPADTTYSVIQTESTWGFTQVAITNDQGTIEADGTAEASFTNAYTVEDEVTLSATATLTNPATNALMSGYTFTFQLFDENNNLLQTKQTTTTTNSGGTVTFDPVVFKGTDAGTGENPKVHRFKIVEVNDSQRYIVYDTHAGWVNVSVSDDGTDQAAHMTITASYEHATSTTADATPETFANTYQLNWELPRTGGSGLVVPVAIGVIIATAVAARRMRRRLNKK